MREKHSAEARVVLVSGGTSGIGAAAVRLLAESGVRCVAAGRRAANQSGPGIACVTGDVNEPGYISKLFTASLKAFGREPDVFVLAAGHGLPGTLLHSEPSNWRALLETNYFAVLRQLRDCASSWLRDGSPTSVRDIVVIGSTIGREVSEMNPVYGSTKFAVHSVVEALRREVCRSSIRVTLIEPGFVKTEFQQTAGYSPEWFGGIEAENGPLLSADDVARVIEFVIRQPGHVHIDDVRIRPTRQKV